MGHGASTNVKKVTLNDQYGDNYRSGWTRSNSDGCIVETSLNSSKTKIELMDQQRTELKELLKTTEENLKESQNMNLKIQKQMAEVEGTNFELRDQVSELEQIVESLQAQLARNQEEDLTETLAAKDLYIEQLQKEANSYLEEKEKLKAKYRKRLNVLKTQVAEVKQEGSLNLYKLKQEMEMLEEENYKLTAKLDRASSASKSRQHKEESISHGNDEASITDWEDSRTKVILQLSTQLTVQQEKIEELQNILEEKERLLKEHAKSLQHKHDGLRQISHGTHNSGKFANERKEKSANSECHQGTRFAQRWKSSSNTDVTYDFNETVEETSHIDTNREMVGSTRVTSATSVTSGLSDISLPDQTFQQTTERRRRKKRSKHSSRQMSAESYDSGVYSGSRNTAHKVPQVQ